MVWLPFILTKRILLSFSFSITNALFYHWLSYSYSLKQFILTHVKKNYNLALLFSFSSGRIRIVFVIQWGFMYPCSPYWKTFRDIPTTSPHSLTCFYSCWIAIFSRPISLSLTFIFNSFSKQNGTIEFFLGYLIYLNGILFQISIFPTCVNKSHFGTTGLK